MTEPFPLIEVSGPPRERGRQYGRQAAGRIALGVEHYAAQLARSGFNAAGIAITANYLESDRDYRQTGVPLALIRRETVTGTMTATVAMIVMEPALGIMEVAPLPALNRHFTTYRLAVGRPAPVAV